MPPTPPAPTDPPTPRTDGDLARLLHDVATAHGLPGAAVGVAAGDELLVATHGVTNAELGRPVAAGSLFQVGSITKTLTAAAVAVLVEEGRLRFEDPVAAHLPGLARTTGLDLDGLTVEHLLSHRAGFDGDHLLVVGGSRGLAGLAGARRLFDPGRGFSYSNAAFSVAGALVEAAAGEPFAAFVRSRLLLPLGMLTAAFRADDVITHDVTAPHWVLDGTAYVIRNAGWQPGWELEPVDWPAGGLVASVEHLLAWARCQWTGRALDGTVLLGAESLARLHAPVVVADALERIALDWFVRELDGETVLGHGGVTPGYVSDLAVVPERRVAVAVLTNATNGGAVTAALRRGALERFAGVRELDPEPDPALVPDVARLGGRYRHAFADLDVTGGVEPGTVVITPRRREVDGWQPPLDPPLTGRLFAPDHLVGPGPGGVARIVRFGDREDGQDREDGGGGERPGPAAWLLWGHRRATRVGDPD